MKSPEVIHIAIAESSVIVRLGLVAVLKRIPTFSVQCIEISTQEALQHCMEAHAPEILIVNPQFEGWFQLEAFKNTYNTGEMKVMALVSSMVDSNQLKDYDETINLFDDLDNIDKKLAQILNVLNEDDNDQDALSQREKEIIGCVVKGMTNKEIADQLFISVHTVITHRRNITRKLQIHSAAGLTIYAIVNKLVDLSDVKMNL